MATITHSLQEVVEKLTAKITALENSRDDVQESVNRQSNLETNTAALNQINARLASAYAARALLHDSCCYSQTCNFEWQA